ncbi:MAG: hypothetical protein JEY97_03960 [Bacteroidales bacterium]|nr:hypothetical protein [Bacteroidales bacterium]
MNQNNQFISLICTLVSTLVVGLVFYFTDYVSNEGFNPSDDGVVLAQSYRIINGEIPHKDFISIRPVFSGVLHTINFASPLPLIISGRISVLFQFFIFSFIWVFILLKHFFTLKSKSKYAIIFSITGISVFVLNVNTYHLYPWTTIDGVFFSLIGFSFLIKLFSLKISSSKKDFYITIALFLFSIAALCKQNFIFLTAFIFLFIIYFYIKEKRLRVLPIVMIAGGLPFAIYLIMLISTGSFQYFIQQMTGRTEFFETGILRYVKSFLKVRFLPLNFIVLFFFFFAFLDRIKPNFISKKNLLPYFSSEKKSIWQIAILLYFLMTIYAAFRIFLGNDYLSITHEAFWILLILFVMVIYIKACTKTQAAIIIFTIILSWVTSISLGANFPGYVFGILISLNFILINQINNKLQLFVFSISQKKVLPCYFAVLVSLLFMISILGQRNTNYRELPASNLTENLGELFPEFGNLKTNPATFNYYSDFKKLYDSNPKMKGHFVLLPNNAAIYPLFDSPNPFPLDWMQKDEYVGTEEHLYEELEKILENEKVYILIDKFNSKQMASEIIEMNYEDYSYMKIIKEKCRKVQTGSEFFDVYLSGK